MFPMRCALLGFLLLSGSATPIVVAQISPLRAENIKITQGITAAMNGENAEATRLFKEAMAETPDLAPPGLDVAGELARGGDMNRIDRVRFWIEKTAEDFPDDPEAFLLLAEFALNERRFVEATLLVRHAESLITAMPEVALRKIPLTGRAMLVHVTASEDRNRWQEAAERLEKILMRWPERTELLARLGRDQFRSGAYDKGIATLREAIGKNKELGSLLPMVAALYEEVGQRDKALHYVAEALEAAPDDVNTLLQASHLKLKWNDIDGAKTHLEVATKQNPELPTVLRQRGILALYDEDFAKAEEILIPLHRAFPGDQTTCSALILALCSQKEEMKLRQAAQLADEMYRNDPNGLESAVALATVLLWNGQLEGAEQLLNDLFDRGEMSSTGAYYMATILMQKQQKKEAEIFLDAALRTGVNFPQRKAAEKLRDELQQAK